MARKRMIHPDFFTSQTMNTLPVTTMLTFAKRHGKGRPEDQWVTCTLTDLVALLTGVRRAE